jgi:hypothetical protein
MRRTWLVSTGGLPTAASASPPRAEVCVERTSVSGAGRAAICADSSMAIDSIQSPAWARPILDVVAVARRRGAERSTVQPQESCERTSVQQARDTDV